MTPLTLSSDYMDGAWDPERVARNLALDFEGVEYDTIVGTGLSGAVIVPQLARILNKYALIVRKPNDGSHSLLPAEGKLGQRWLFVDDFIFTGTTRTRVINAVTELAAKRDYKTEYVGAYLYEEENNELEANA
jgi:adenine/guanine phosphoribosyltransferase-like PRPP-binding protein